MLILWLSDNNAKEIQRRLRSWLFWAFLPFELIDPLYKMLAEPGKHRLYSNKESAVNVTYDPQNKLSKYVAVCAGIVFPRRLLWLVAFLQLSGFVTDPNLKKRYPA